VDQASGDERVTGVGQLANGGATGATQWEVSYTYALSKRTVEAQGGSPDALKQLLASEVGKWKASSSVRRSRRNKAGLGCVAARRRSRGFSG
jgi:hypothetical protein